MAQNFRHSEILTIAREAGKVTVEGLATHFNVTAQTIRRDLGELCDVGQLTRVHGGAMIPSGVIALGYEDRRSLASQEKDAIARMVAQQIPDGVSIFMNIGTTTEAVARALLKHRNLMVITNNLNVANILATSPNSEVIVAGGILRRADGALVGDVTAEFIGQFKVDYAIIGSAAVDPDGSLLDYDFREVRVAQAIIKNARKSYLVADHTKFKMVAPVRIASLADLDGFFTDIAPPRSVMQLVRRQRRLHPDRGEHRPGALNRPRNRPVGYSERTVVREGLRSGEPITPLIRHFQTPECTLNAKCYAQHTRYGKRGLSVGVGHPKGTRSSPERCLGRGNQ